MAKQRGNNSNNGGGNNEPDPDEDELSEAVINTITRTVNATVTAHLSRKLGPALKEALGTELTEIRDTLTQIAGGKPNAGAGGDGKGNEGKGQNSGQPGTNGQQPAPSLKDDPEVVAMRKRLAALEDERKKERETAQNNERDGTLREILTAAKIDPNRMRGAIAVVRDSVKRDAEGKLVYKAQRQGYVDDLTLEDGVAEWLATDEGKSYQAPAQGVRGGGAGTRQAGAARGGGGVAGVVKGGANAPTRGAQDVNVKAQRRQAAFDALSAAINTDDGGTVEIG